MTEHEEFLEEALSVIRGASERQATALEQIAKELASIRIGMNFEEAQNKQPLDADAMKLSMIHGRVAAGLITDRELAGD